MRQKSKGVKMEKETSLKKKNENDLKLYQEFLTSWESKTIDDSNPVLKMVKGLSTMAHKYGRENWIKDIEQETFLKLSTCNYNGEGSLKGYIRKIMQNVLFGMYRKEKESKRGEMPSEVRDEKKFDELLTEFDERFQEPLSDRVKMLLSETPENLWWYVEAVLEADRYISQREIAEDLNISRYEVANAHIKLKSIWENVRNEAGYSGRKTQISGTRKNNVLPKENDLVYRINNVFSADERQRYNVLYDKFQKGNITEKEKTELIKLSDKFEILNAKRLKYLGELAILRKQSLREVINDLGIKS